MPQRRFDEPARELIRQLTLERDQGFEFVPLVGAGLSAPSGVPIIREVRSYLLRCLAASLGLDHPDVWKPDSDTDRSPSDDRLAYYRCRRWLPGRDEWPPFGDPQIYARDTVDWERRLERVVVELRRRQEAREAQRTQRGQEDLDRNSSELRLFQEVELFQEGFGAAAEWRSLLLFLSRLRLKNPGSTGEALDHTLTLGPPDLDIVDTFFLNVVEGKQPTLGHRMLARLVGPLRINTVLTTNFDELLEQAFSETGNELIVFDVHVESGLPPYRNMQHKNALVKLHGGRYGLRADYSLDKPPTDNDRRHFVSYLAAQHIEPSLWRERHVKIPARRHLIVCGMSGADTRITLMVREAVQRLSGLRIFWIAFSQRDKEIALILKQELSEIRSATSSCTNPALPSADSTDDDRSPWFSVVHHHFPGLLFLRCYQGLTRSLPASRVIFPSAPRLPVPPELIETQRVVPLDGDNGQKDEEADGTSHGSPDRDSSSATGETADSTEVTPYADQIASRIQDCIDMDDRDDNWRRVIFISGKRGQFLGASTAAAQAYGAELDRGRQCVWIDLDEIASCNDLFEVILHTVARKAGVTDWMPVLLLTEDSDVNQNRVELEQLTEISRLTNNPNRPWVIFLNGRCGAGANFVDTDDYRRYRSCYPNGWLDWRKGVSQDPAGFFADGPTTSADAVIELLRRLCGSSCPNVSVVFLCFEGPFFEAVRQKMPAIPEPVGIGHNELTQPAGSKDQSYPPKNVTSPKQIVDTAHDWVRAPAIDAKDDEDTRQKRQQFLYALSLTNRVRYPASMWTWPFHWRERDTTARRVELTDIWLSDLEALHVIRRKRGGFIWMHCDIRNRLRTSVPALNGIQTDSNHPRGVAEWAAAIHHGLAEWNQKLLVASDTPAPAFEVVYHRCRQCVAMLQHQRVTHGQELLAAISDATNALETSRPFMLSVGFSKSVCRRLQQVRKAYVRAVELSLEPTVREDGQPDATASVEDGLRQEIRHRLQLLRVASLRLNRMIAREVGENMVAFRRHRELRVWQFVSRKLPDLGHAHQGTTVDAILFLFEPNAKLEHLTIAVRGLDELLNSAVPDTNPDRTIEELNELLERVSADDGPGLQPGASNVSSHEGADANACADQAVLDDAKQIRKNVLNLESGANAEEWIESCNEAGTLALAVRSFKDSEESFSRVLDKFGFQSVLPESSLNQADHEAVPFDLLDPEDTRAASLNPEAGNALPIYYREIREPLVKWLTQGIRDKLTEFEQMPEDGPGQAAVLNAIHTQLLKTFQRMLQMLLARGHVELTVSRRQRDEIRAMELYERSKSSFGRAQRCTEVGRQILNYLSRDSQRFEARDGKAAVVRDDLSRWFDDRQRMETLDALAQSAAGDFERALRRLNEAESALNEARHQRLGMEKAIIDLHRVEVLTQQAMSAGQGRPSGPTQGMSVLGMLRHRVLTAANENPNRGRSGKEKSCSRRFVPRNLQTLAEILKLEIRAVIASSTADRDVSVRCDITDSSSESGVDVEFSSAPNTKTVDLSCGRSDLLDDRPGATAVVFREVPTDRTRTNLLREKLRSSLSPLKDAWQTLTRAERQLRLQRKNVWWTTWFFDLQLKVIELQVFAAVCERMEMEIIRNRTDATARLDDGESGTAQIIGSQFDCLLPHIGLEAAPHGTPTIADRLLDNADRMVRLDMFRIARTAESYSNCVLNLALWRSCLEDRTQGSDWRELGRRQEEMRVRLVGRNARDPNAQTAGVRNSIATRAARRNELDKLWRNTQLDDFVKEYVEYVQGHVDAVADLTMQGLWESYKTA